MMASGYKCKRCSNPEPIPEHMDTCPACGAQATAPNVRAAETQEETEALQKRLEAAETETDARGCKDVLDAFGNEVESSVAVVACSLTKIKELVSKNALYNTFHRQVSSASRIPEDNKFDRKRTAVDSIFFPNYHDRIVFGALSLNGKGVKSYGSGFIVLKDESVSLRSSVFEMNTFTFVENQHIGITQDIPPGYRAPWLRRSALARAKLHAKISKSTKNSDFPRILLDSDASAESADFIEVHIYGEFNRAAIQKVYFIESSDKADKLIESSAQRALQQHGISCEKI